MRFEIGEEVVTRIPHSRLPYIATVIGLDKDSGFVGLRLFVGKVNDKEEYWIHQDFVRKHETKKKT